jgi:hypothetical protein
VTTTSVNSLSVTTQRDSSGIGTFDLTQTEVTVLNDSVGQRRVNRDNPALLAQFDCQKAAYFLIMGCDGRQGVYRLLGFYQCLLCAVG